MPGYLRLWEFPKAWDKDAFLEMAVDLFLSGYVEALPVEDCVKPRSGLQHLDLDRLHGFGL